MYFMLLILDWYILIKKLKKNAKGKKSLMQVYDEVFFIFVNVNIKQQKCR